MRSLLGNTAFALGAIVTYLDGASHARLLQKCEFNRGLSISSMAITAHRHVISELLSLQKPRPSSCLRALLRSCIGLWLTCAEAVA